MATKKTTAMNLRDVAVIYNSGNYHGYAPTVACKKAGDVAYDTCGAGRLWQWTGQRWAPLMWMSGARFILGEGNNVQEKINSPGSMIPEYIKLYPGDAPEVPADLRWKDVDLCINHNMGILPAQISCTYLEPLSQVWVTVEPEDGSCLTSIDGSWTVWRNFFCVTGTGKTVITLTELINECDEGGGPIPDPSSDSSFEPSSSSSAEPSSSSSSSSEPSSSSSYTPEPSSSSAAPITLDDIVQGTRNKYLSAAELAFLQSLVPAIYVNSENSVVFRTAPKVLGPDGLEHELSLDESVVTFHNPDGYDATTGIKTTVGGLSTGTVIDGMKVIPLMQKMLFPYDKPEIEDFTVIDNLLECGAATSTANTFQFNVSNPTSVVQDTTKLIAGDTTVIRSGFDVAEGTLTVSNMSAYTRDEPDVLSFQFSFTDTEGNQHAASTEIRWEYAGFFCADQNSGSQPTVEGIESGTYKNADSTVFDGPYIRSQATEDKTIIGLKEGLQIRLPITANTRRVYFAVPDTCKVTGIRSETLQYNYLDAFTRATISMPTANNTKTVSYHVYLYQAMGTLSPDTFLIQL